MNKNAVIQARNSFRVNVQKIIPSVEKIAKSDLKTSPKKRIHPRGLIYFRVQFRRRRTALSVSCPCLFLSGFSGNSCPVSVCCPDSVRIVRKKLSVQILFQNSLFGFCPEFSKKRCPRPADGAVHTFGILVHRRLIQFRQNLNDSSIKRQ